jgi:hypothetical protein
MYIFWFKNSLKTSLMKWKADFDIAADEYNKAGKEKLVLNGQLVKKFIVNLKALFYILFYSIML